MFSEKLIQSLNKKHATKTSRPRKRSRFEKNSLGHDGGIYFNKRGDGRIIPHIIVPKILKSDPRRSFPAIFRNVLNTCDSSVLYQFLNTYYRPDCIFYHQVPNDVSLKTGKQSYTQNSTACFAEVWLNNLKCKPDFAMQLGHSTICVRSDGTCVLNFKYRMMGTVLMPPPRALPAVVNDSVFSACESPRCGEGSSIVSSDSEADLLQSFSDGLSTADELSRDEPQTISNILNEVEREPSDCGVIYQPSHDSVLAAGPTNIYSFQLDGLGVMHLDESSLVSAMHLNLMSYASF